MRPAVCPNAAGDAITFLVEFSYEYVAPAEEYTDWLPHRGACVSPGGRVVPYSRERRQPTAFLDFVREQERKPFPYMVLLLQKFFDVLGRRSTVAVCP